MQLHNTPPLVRMIKIGVCPERLYVVAVQRYVGKHQSNEVNIAGDPNLGTHLCW